MSDLQRKAFKDMLLLVHQLHHTDRVMLHRDIDAANIMVHREETGYAGQREVEHWKLGDFGSSRVAASSNGFSQTAFAGHSRTQHVRIADSPPPATPGGPKKYTPRPADDNGSLAIVFHEFLSNGRHPLCGAAGELDFQREIDKFNAQPTHLKYEQLHKLEHFGLQDRGPRYSDAHDLFLYMADERNQCSLEVATKHPFLWSSEQVQNFMEALRHDVVDKRPPHCFMRIFDFRDPTTVVHLIAGLPHGLKEIAVLGAEPYRRLLLWKDHRGFGTPNFGWASQLPPYLESHSLDLQGAHDDPKFFRVGDLVRCLHNMFKHLHQRITLDELRTSSDRFQFQYNLPRIDFKSHHEFLTALIREKFPFLLSHLYHILQHYKDDGSLVSPLLRDMC